MANVQRYIEGSRNTLLINVLSAVTVQTGDLMFIDKINNLRVNGSSTANNYGYPAEYLRTSGSSLEINKETFKTYFLGVALDYKDGIEGGVDLNIPVATSGKFNFDLKPARSIFTGDMFGVSGTSIDDEGNRNAGDSETVLADITAAGTNGYHETIKKWLGTITFTLTETVGDPTAYTINFNYGYSKYEDFGNQSFSISGLQVTGEAGAADTGFNMILYHHSTSGWAYLASNFVPGGTISHFRP